MCCNNEEEEMKNSIIICIFAAVLQIVKNDESNPKQIKFDFLTFTSQRQLYLVVKIIRPTVIHIVLYH